MISGCAAPTGLPGHDQRVRASATAAHERPGQRHGDPGATAPDHRAGTPTGPDAAAVLSRRPRVPRGAAAPTPGRRASSAPSTGAPGNSPALAQGPARPPPRSQISSQATRPTTNHPLDPTPGAAPGTRESRLGLPPRPWRIARPRHHNRRLHRLADPQRRVVGSAAALAAARPRRGALSGLVGTLPTGWIMADLGEVTSGVAEDTEDLRDSEGM